MVQDVIKSLRPKFVVLELCESRIDSLYELEINEQLMVNVTLLSVLKTSWEERSVKTLGTGLLCWMQIKAARAMGSKLGGELAIAAKEAAAIRSTIVLGDRLYGVTIQRVFDKLSVLEKFKMGLLLFWEVVTLSVLRLREYVKKTDDEGFINKEIEKFAQTLPTFSRIILGERDEYMTQTLLEIARIGFPAHHSQGIPQLHRGCIVVVCGAAHVNGIERLLASGGSSEEHIRNISSSSRHNSTWPGAGMLQVVNSEALWNQ
jgi:pheromone shutdown protein TraB